jgi:hypothetical protein
MIQQPKPYLQWLSNDKLENAVLKVYLAMKKAMEATTLADLQTQIIDPFSVLFETGATDMTSEAWLKSEAQRQAQKSWMNQVGYFHQDILGSCRFRNR